MNLLFTSVGRRSYLIRYFKEALGKNGIIHAANSDPRSPAFNFADEHVVTPIIYDGAYIEFLLEYCSRNDINAVIPLFDVDLPVLSANKTLFENIGVRVVVSNEDTVAVCNDKWLTYLFCIRNNIGTPKTYLDIDEALSDLKKGTLSFPLVIKPRWGMGSIAVFEADDIYELKVFYHKAEKIIASSYLKYETRDRLNEGVLIQEKICGQEYGMDIINDLDGCYYTTIVKKKYAMRSGETDCAETVDNMLLKNFGRDLSFALRHSANLDTDLFMVDEAPYLIDMNARFGGGYPFSHLAGVNLPLAIIRWLNNERVTGKILKERFGVMSSKSLEAVILSAGNEAL